MRRFMQVLTVVLSVMAFSAITLIVYYDLVLPDSFYIKKGQSLEINTMFNVTANYSVTDFKTDLNNKDIAIVSNLSDTQILADDAKVDLKLFGLFPIKTSDVEQITDSMLIPGGAPFGIKLFTDGVVVIGLNEIDSSGIMQNPAKSAGIKIGDIIVEMDGEKIYTNEDVANIIIRSNGEKIKILVNRNSSMFTTSLYPVLDSQDNTFKGGLWVRDSSAGIGTVTFYNPITQVFGGLGHAICDVDTGKILPLMSGDVVGVNINNVYKGNRGTPGELRGNFISSKPIGGLSINDETGVYGVMYNNNIVSGEPIPIALKQEIKEGNATILTTLEGSKPKEYEVKIEKVQLGFQSISKNMVIKITDKSLLDKTGGIVQGMSGSPIIQNGKIVGAVTHVFVNDPTKGYGIFIENMYEKSKDVKLPQDNLEYDKAS